MKIIIKLLFFSALTFLICDLNGQENAEVVEPGRFDTVFVRPVNGVRVSGSEKNVYGVSVFKDALKLRDLINSRKIEEIKTLLSNYGFDEGGDGTSNRFLNGQLTNVLPNTFQTELDETEVAVDKAAGGTFSRFSSLVSPVAVADGLASFTATRFREELTIAFLEDFFAVMEELNYYHQLGVVMPATTATVLQVKDGVWEFKKYLTTIKESMLADISNLPVNILPYALSQLRPGSSFDEYLPFLTIDLVVQKVVNDVSLLETIGNWDRKTYLFGSGKNEVSIVSALLRNLNNTNGDLLLSSDLSRLNSDVNIRNCFLGLLMAKEGNITGRLTSEQKRILESLADSEVAERVAGLLKLIEEYNQIFRGNDTSVERVLTNTIAMLRAYGIELPSIIQNLEIESVINQVFKLEAHVRNEQIGLAVQDFVELLRTLNINNRVVDNIGHYGMFMANLAQAKTGEDMASLLEDVVLPVGSYRLKRQQQFTFGLQAYVGLGGGISSSGAANFSKGHQFGIISPIGFDFAWGLKKTNNNTRKNKAFSLFISVVDLGPITGWHIANVNDKELTYTEDFKWKHILSPGLFLIYHTGSVVSMGAYGQRSAFSVDITSENNVVVEDANLTRFGLFVAADIPLFQFWTKRK